MNGTQDRWSSYAERSILNLPRGNLSTKEQEEEV